MPCLWVPLLIGLVLCSQVVKGWTEAMQLMGEGDKWQLFLPSELAYGELPCISCECFSTCWLDLLMSGLDLRAGDRQRGQFITPGAVLVFELEILTVKGDTEKGATDSSASCFVCLF